MLSIAIARATCSNKLWVCVYSYQNKLQMYLSVEICKLLLQTSNTSLIHILSRLWAQKCNCIWLCVCHQFIQTFQVFSYYVSLCTMHTQLQKKKKKNYHILWSIYIFSWSSPLCHIFLLAQSWGFIQWAGCLCHQPRRRHRHHWQHGWCYWRGLSWTGRHPSGMGGLLWVIRQGHFTCWRSLWISEQTLTTMIIKLILNYQYFHVF